MNSGGIFDYPAKERKLNEVNAALEDPKVWDNPKRAQELGKEKKSLEDVVTVIDRLSSELADNTELFDMSKSEGDEGGMLGIEGEAVKVAVEVEKMEFRRMFNNPADPLSVRSKPNAYSPSILIVAPLMPAAPKPATGPACCCGST
jgi:peptide chain release factor 2